MNKLFLTAAMAAVFCMSSASQAAIQFSESDLTSMTIFDSLTYGFTEAQTGDGLTNADNYYPAGPAMTGLAGATGFLTPGDPDLPQAMVDRGWAATAFYSLPPGGSELAAINASGESIVESIGWNDNGNDDWVVGIWAVDSTWPFGGDGSGVDDSLVLAQGDGGPLSIDLSTLNDPDDVRAAGVFVALLDSKGQGDQFHASWAIPEPTSMLVWGALGLVSLATGRRNRD